MKTVLLRAPVLTGSGYGVHSRQIARWLLGKEKEHNLSVTVEALNWGNTPWYTNPSSQDGLIGELMAHTGNKKQNYDVTIQLQLPNEWNPQLGKFNIGVTAGVETDKCNPAWIDAVNRMNLVIVPANFVKDTFMNSGKVNTPIIVIPEAFPDEMLKDNQEIDLQIETSFNFLVFGQFTGNNPENDRKNLFYTLKWLCETFENDKEVGILVKTNLGRNSKIDRQNTKGLLAKLIAEIRKSPFPKIHLLHGELTDKEVCGLYRHPKVKGLVSLSRGEGFGLPLLEAASCGLPVIATGWSAHTEFLNLGKYTKIDYNLQSIHESRLDNNIFMQGARWAQVSETDAKQKIKRFRDSVETPKLWALDLQKEIRNQYDFNTISNMYDKVLENLLK